MLTIFRTHALFTALLIIILYAAWFIVPSLYIDIDPSKTPVSDISNMIYQWKTQIVVFGVLVTFVTLLKWWREVGFTPMHEGGLKFLLPPLLFLLILFSIALFEDKGNTLFLGFTSLKQLVSFLLILLMLTCIVLILLSPSSSSWLAMANDRGSIKLAAIATEKNIFWGIFIVYSIF